MNGWQIVILTIAVAFIKLGQGFDFDLKTIFARENRPVIIKGLFVGVVLIPIVFAFLIVIFQPSFTIVAMLIVTAVCPAADISIQEVEQLGGDVALANSVQFISSTIAILTIPLLLTFLEFTSNIHIKIPYRHLIWDVSVAQFVPIILGMALRKYFPAYIWVGRYIVKAAMWLLLACFMILLIQNYSFFGEIGFRAYAALIVATLCAYILGVIFSGKNYKKQISLGIESSFRNPGLVYLIALENFREDKIKIAIVPYICTTLVVVMLCTMLLKMAHRIFHRKIN